jgi:ELWxxDGT repeat protein
MRTRLLKVPTLLFLFIVSNSFGQVSLLSNNTNLTSGLVVNGKGLLIAENDSLWVTDGSAGGTVKLINTMRATDTGGIVYQGKLFGTGVTAANGYEFWVTDATTAGTTLVKDINPGAANSNAKDYHVYNNKIFFAADNGTNGIELWSSDGTAAGTTLFKDINPGAGSSLTNNARFFQVNGILYFVATDGTNGEELWRTDGTAGGTTMVANITAGSASTTFTEFSKLGNTIIFSITKGSFFNAQLELWKSDGTTAGTILLRNFGNFSGLFPPFFYPFNSKLYFIGTETATGSELWATDGTTVGTALVKDIEPGEESSTPFTFNAITMNNKLYFQATTTAAGSELWVSDGSNAGTQLFVDINPGAPSAAPLFYINYDTTTSLGFYGGALYNGKIFFEADNGTNGNELWSTNGTVAGTSIVKDIAPGAASGIDSIQSYFYTTTGLYFSASNGANGYEPWLSDGTSAGTTQVFDINPGAGSSEPYYFMLYNNQLYFNANNGDNNIINLDLYKFNATLLPLPISMLNFSLTKQTSNAVKVDWVIANEVNGSYYTVERSIDAVNYAAIGTVNSKQTSNKESYSYIDAQAGGLNRSVLYYRLRLVDKDGSFKHTNTLKINFDKAAFQLKFSPNPVQNSLTVSVSTGNSKAITLRIIDASGKQVYQQFLPTSQTVYQQNINVARLQKGSYFIQAITDQEVVSQKFIKQ